MKVYINNQPLDLLPGMKIKHALINAGLLEEIITGKKVYDEWSHEVGLEGALTEGMALWVR
jgi:hypothetical protein